MPRMRDIRPGERVTDFRDGDILHLLPGVHRPIVIGGGTESVTIEGPEGPERSIIDADRAEFGIRGHDGCNGLTVRGLTLREAGHGARVTVSQEVTFEDVIAEDCEAEGLHLSFCPGAYVRRVRVRKTGYWSRYGYPPDRAHALYLAGDSSGSEIEDLTGEDLGGSLLQCNAASTRNLMTNIVARRMIGKNTGRGGGGTFHFALMGVRASTFEKFQVSGGRGLVTLFADGKGAEFACKGCMFRDFTIDGLAHIREEEGSSGNSVVPGNGWQPTTSPPAPGPPATNPPDELTELRQQVKRHQEALVEARADRDRLAAWRDEVVRSAPR